MENCVIPVAAVVGFTVFSLFMSSCSEPKIPPAAISSPMILKLTLEELVAQADHIIIGKVVGKGNQSNADTSPYTLITISVEEWIKGELEDDVLIIKLPSNKLDKTTQWVEDTANLKIDEKVVVFLKIYEDGTFGIVGGRQGKLVVEEGKIADKDLSLIDLVSKIKAEVDKASR